MVWGRCLVLGGYLVPGGGVWSWGVPGPGGGGCLVPRGSALGGGGWFLLETGTAAGGTHPTGMHSCSCLNFVLRVHCNTTTKS